MLKKITNQWRLCVVWVEPKVMAGALGFGWRVGAD
jgi:hypothetical protein